MNLDYRKLGLKVGLEIHQQLKTDTKLFCSCRAILSSKPPEFTFYRRLRPTQSELGVVDPAAAFEFQRGRGYVYEADMETSCLVEMDEEPPHCLNEEAVDIGLMVAMMLNSKPVDEIHVMRKIVLDGSNTTGFQRTCIVSLGGEIIVEGKRIGIQSVSLEEDAARKVGEEGTITRYRLDRLCMPLIEIATAPEIYDPEEAEKVALALGRVLRATGKVRRGLGTIRQDLNISILGGALTEIKGIQELELVKPIIEAEVRRQVGLLGIRDELVKRAATKEDLSMRSIDVSELFKDTACKILRSALEKGHSIIALKLPKFAGLLGREIAPGLRFGTELSDYARFWGGSEGILHTDELPGYGITTDEVAKLRNAVGAKPNDAVVIVAQSGEDVSCSIRAILDRAAAAFDGIPSETRSASLDGCTHFSRPRPGAARMYPETDIPPFVVSDERLMRIKSSLPPLPEVKLRELVDKYYLSEKLALQVMNSDYFDVFVNLANCTNVPPSFIAATLTETFKNLHREGLNIQAIAEEEMYRIFKAVDKGVMAKEAIVDVVKWLAANPSKTFDDALSSLNLSLLPEDKVIEYVDRLVNENESLIAARGVGAIGPLMGEVMRNFRGKIDAKFASTVLRRKIEDKLNQTQKV